VRISVAYYFLFGSSWLSLGTQGIGDRLKTSGTSYLGIRLCFM
jgi:hypothetical protein